MTKNYSDGYFKTVELVEKNNSYGYISITPNDYSFDLYFSISPTNINNQQDISCAISVGTLSHGTVNVSCLGQ